MGDKNPKKEKKKKKAVDKVSATAGSSVVIAEPVLVKNAKKQK